jgi:hypothetical protein
MHVEKLEIISKIICRTSVDQPVRSIGALVEAMLPARL